ncbi:hypothetical protein K491DRAFT_237346 [Lophiostoma macrostomum CBS 122681]|uniref:Uncharacterized protein n=1 Tax=Lophiostoma macrostomum CBS 122681 TaxID=1314788 RepID=A0A6A6TGP7_9PLEO|nr:hypothetical protein K491DRAFT_237346 [Lophiostoma macrostomum CBS 122681]
MAEQLQEHHLYQHKIDIANSNREPIFATGRQQNKYIPSVFLHATSGQWLAVLAPKGLKRSPPIRHRIERTAFSFRVINRNGDVRHRASWCRAELSNRLCHKKRDISGPVPRAVVERGTRHEASEGHQMLQGTCLKASAFAWAGRTSPRWFAYRVVFSGVAIMGNGMPQHTNFVL